jgi:hypothetical protein
MLAKPKLLTQKFVYVLIKTVFKSTFELSTVRLSRLKIKPLQLLNLQNFFYFHSWILKNNRSEM